MFRVKNQKLKKLKWAAGFTSLELIIGIAIFVILVAGALAVISSLTTTVKLAREKTILSSLVAADLEIVRNLPYSEVGTVNGNPSGSLPDESNPRNITSEGQSYEIYYEVTYLDDAADGTILSNPADAAPNDYKQVKMFVRNTVSGKVTTILTNIAPKGLEGLTNAGALIVNVFDAVGQPVANANVHIENLSAEPDIVLDRTTDSAGQWIEVGLPAAVNGYHVVVTKSGYSTDATYPITTGNPNPVKPDATILEGQVTQVSFAIDLVANLIIQTVNDTCQPISGVAMNVRGEKLIGTAPDVYKFNDDYTSSGGQVGLSNVEWDSYTPALDSGASYSIIGTSPIQQITVLPGSNQLFRFVLGSSTPNSLRVIVKDAATGTALENAYVLLTNGTDTFDGFTGGSVWNQLDWSGGPGQADFSSNDKYFVDDGHIDVTTPPTGVRLQQVLGSYDASGVLESSTFDTGTELSDFSSITWQPTSQHPATELKFQVASSNDIAGPWDAAAFRGPDGTSATYYTVPGITMSTVHDNNRYVRYRAFLSTSDPGQTPVLSNIALNYVSGCFTPGQKMFPELTSGNWRLEVSLAGYATQIVDPVNINGNVVYEILLSP